MDDISLDEETDTSYVDLVPVAPFVGTGQPVGTEILTRAFTGGDFYSYKTGINVEFEFEESVCAEVMIKVYLDRVLATDPTTNSDLIAPPFSTLSEPRRRLPIPLPFTLPASPPLLRKAFDLAALRDMAGIAVFITTTSGKLSIRSIRLTFFMDTIRLQTIPTQPGDVFEPAPEEAFPV